MAATARAQCSRKQFFQSARRQPTGGRMPTDDDDGEHECQQNLDKTKVILLLHNESELCFRNYGELM